MVLLKEDGCKKVDTGNHCILEFMGRNMSKKLFDSKYVGEKVAVSCSTFKDAKDFLMLAEKFEYTWRDRDRYSECLGDGIENMSIAKDILWNPEICFYIYKGTIARLSSFAENDFTIVTYPKPTNEFISAVNFIFDMDEGEYVTDGLNLYQITPKGLVDREEKLNMEATMDLLLGRVQFSEFTQNIEVTSVFGDVITITAKDWLDLVKKYNS